MVCGCEKTIFCPICKKSLGIVSPILVKGSDGITTREGEIYFVCSSCGKEVWVCKNSEKITLTHIKVTQRIW
jgi:predicted RNA-binding Zn-ribbon protein involved in translation (DUF1610 family)